jgi:septal ring-binding cell division protein DamX
MPRDKKVSSDDDRRHLIYTGSLIGAVVGTLLIGAILRADPDDPRAARATMIADVPVAAQAAPAPAPLPSYDPPPKPTAAGPAARELALGVPFEGDDDLADRALADEGRLHASGEGYTLQFAVVCDPDNARAQVERLGDEPGLYVLTTLLDDRVCFRLCWGFYDSERQALSARDVPRQLRAITREPKVLSVREALP